MQGLIEVDDEIIFVTNLNKAHKADPCQVTKVMLTFLSDSKTFNRLYMVARKVISTFSLFLSDGEVLIFYEV